MKKCHKCGTYYDEILEMCPKCGVVRPEEISATYRFWWAMQVLTLFGFLTFLIWSILSHWWLLIIGFVFLSLNLYTNVRRLRVLHTEIMGLPPEKEEV